MTSINLGRLARLPQSSNFSVVRFFACCTVRLCRAVLVLLLVATYPGCGRKNAVGIDVDLYLHAEATSPEDLLLQTAIQDQIDKNATTHNSLIHVRVVDKIAFLDGSVETEKEKGEAENIARNTAVAVNGAAIKVTDVRSHINVQP
jgi:hypothetical protein